jgi:hypothetical protein
MGTKNNPGKFDCYANAEPDEPMFVLLGRDRLAAHLVSIWSKVRMGDMEAANAVFLDMLHKHAPEYVVVPDDVAKATEAMDCSLAMFKFRAQNRGRTNVKSVTRTHENR